MRIKTVIAQLELAQLLTETPKRIDDIGITSLSYDSRANRPGSLFFCKGNQFKPTYLDQAVENGAVCYVSEEEYEVVIPGIIVSDIRRAMAVIADTFYDHPYRSFYTVGITGTKGKTTTATFLKAIMDAWAEREHQQSSGLISSTRVVTGQRDESAVLTTPEALPLYHYLNEAKQSSLPFVTMEVSSQALKYHRTDGIAFNAVAFLNISEDHISPIEHPTFEDYLASKLRIFQISKNAVVNLDADEAD
ncbi:MAG: Mur ligase family protein, partial [Planctomycetia bacterium]|nr:Mur ligase family protein [Planctomycetia bacterium]